MAVRVIKRYKNRKLYDSTAGSYVALAEIADLIRSGETIQVSDQESGDDLTAATLMQIILDEGKKGVHFLPADMLHDLVRRSSKSLDEGVRHVRGQVESLIRSSLDALGTWLPASHEASELKKLRAQLAALEERLAQLLDEDNKTT